MSSLDQESASAVRDDSAEHEAVPESEFVQSPRENQASPGAAEQAAVPETESAQSPQENQTSPGAADQTAVPEVQIELPGVASPAAETVELDTLMMADMEKVAALPTGQIVQGTVLKITDTEVFVDVGLKTEASVPLAEFQSEDGQVSVEPGSTVGVWVEGYDEKEGAVTLSRRKAARQELWERIEHAFQAQTPITGRVLERVKGGLAVDIGIKAFMPLSQADLRPLRNPESLLGQEISVKVIKYARKRANVVVSRKLVLEDEANARKAVLVEKLHEGAELVGHVKNLTDYGAFVDLGGMDGLLHITDMSWQRLKHPSDAVQAGQEITVKVLKYDAEKGRISLGLKQLTPDPWASVGERFHAGDRIRGRVVSITDYGAFVEVEPGIEGLIHVSEMSWSKRAQHPSKIVNKGDEAEVTVLDVKPAERRLSLSLRQTLPNPWTSFTERCTVGTEVEAVVRNLTDFGAFVEIEPGVEGLIHVSDLSWTKKIKHPSEVLKKGQNVKAVILRLEPEGQRISLGLKQLETDPWEDFLAATKVGDLVRGKVVRLAPFGAFVELREGVEGLCHSSEVNGGIKGEKKVELEAGQEYDFRVLRINGGEKKIGLSRKGTVQNAAAAQAPAAASPPKKPPAPMTAMAEAFSSAGITTLAAPAEPAAPAAPEPAPGANEQPIPPGD
jgi:small subunit ribosomal protein S1